MGNTMANLRATRPRPVQMQSGKIMSKHKPDVGPDETRLALHGANAESHVFNPCASTIGRAPPILVRTCGSNVGDWNTALSFSSALNSPVSLMKLYSRRQGGGGVVALKKS